MSSFDMDKLMQQAAQMQEQVARMQEEAEQETAQSSVGGGLVKVTANGAGEVVAIEISPDAIDPTTRRRSPTSILAGVNEALRSAQGRGRGEGAADARRHGPRRARAPRARRVSTPPPRRGVRGRYLFSNWLWAIIVLALIGVVIWGWAFDFSPR